jgi:hypothetical protein
MSMFGKALGAGAEAFMSGAKRMGKGAMKVGRVAAKGVARDIPAGYKAAKAGVGKALDTTPRTAGRNLKAAMKNVSRDPAKMKKLGKKVAKYGAAGAAGYGLAKMMNKSED